MGYELQSEDPNMHPSYFDIEIIDLFPHDHPFLNEDPLLMDETARAMHTRLDHYVRSPYDDKMTLR